ncbi:WD repeat-containing protein 55 [Dichanthelium oligosanthes]|uniref:WD repeat-containing protein 55 n=1 Tax=Dichanthelium oligosanthes TaxID=888268 RepID=A0A1E5VPX2_9POAL|nr:WD repeat-containing protein 55 [Dichanthelium oligosanthes]
MEVLHEETPFDLDFHPSSPLVVTSLITGELCLFRYGPESQPESLFFFDLKVIFSKSSQGVMQSCSLCGLRKRNGINRLVCLTETTIATGDDEGCIKVWDTRERSCCNTFHVHEDYISDMTYVADSNQILATSGDGTLSVNSLRRNKVKSQSEFSEDELLSLVLMKNGKKVVCGTPSGALLLYSWGYFKDCRLVGILPNRIIRPLAEHSEYPIEALAFSNDKKYLGSLSHDKMLKLWDLQELLNGPQAVNGDEPAESGSDDSDDDNDDDGMDVDMAPTSSKGSRSKKPGKGQGSSRPASDFFADL